MATVGTGHEVTIWMVNDIPARMYFAGQRWKVTDAPTRLRESIWSSLPGRSGPIYGWRFQATNEGDESFVFDIVRSNTNWHVHRTYI